MTRDQREVAESPLEQGTREERVYSFDFANAGVTTIEGVPTLLILDGNTNDVTATVMPDGESGTYSGTVATANELKALEAGHCYYVYCAVPHDGGQVTELFVRVWGR